MTPKKIPKEDIIVQTIKEVIGKRRIVQSQDDFCFLVLKELRKLEPGFALSPQRVKRLVLKIPNIDIKAKTKRMPEIRRLEKCPVCNSKVKKIFGKNLLNKKIHSGYVCKRCGYTTDLESFMPMKYVFIWNKKRIELLPE